jgi:hypothetical protein
MVKNQGPFREKWIINSLIHFQFFFGISAAMKEASTGEGPRSSASSIWQTQAA